MPIVFVISDLLAPLWWFLIMRYTMKRGLTAWQAWLVASTLCVAQAYLVAKFIGWNFGGYVIVFIAAIPSILASTKAVSDLGLWFWVLPPTVLIIISAALLYLIGKSRSRANERAQNKSMSNRL